MGEERDTWREPRSDIICLEGNGYRPSHKGDGWREGAMYTLNETEVHAVCYAVGVDLYNQTMTGGVAKTLNAIKCDSDHVPCVLVYESHNQDSRYRPLGDICETVSAKYGTGGGNQPIVLRYERSKELLRDELR